MNAKDQMIQQLVKKNTENADGRKRARSHGRGDFFDGIFARLPRLHRHVNVNAIIVGNTRDHRRHTHNYKGQLAGNPSADRDRN